MNFCDENATKEKLPIHIILGAADFQRIKTTEAPILGPNPDEDPVAEFTSLGWIISGKKTTPCPQVFERLVKTFQEEFESMSSLEVLGLSEIDPRTEFDHEEFQDQLERLEDGTYCTQLPWKPDHPLSPTNEKRKIP